MGSRHSNSDPFRDLTWGDLTFWAGKTAVLAGRSLQKGAAVKRLSKTPEGGLIAWVHAEEIFATLVAFDGGELYCQCGCHGGEDGCEHAIATILEFIAHLKKNVSVPAAAPNDERFHLL